MLIKTKKKNRASFVSTPYSTTRYTRKPEKSQTQFCISENKPQECGRLELLVRMGWAVMF